MERTRRTAWTGRALALALLALALASSCAGGGPRASSTDLPATTDVTVPGDVTVAGRVEEVLHPRLFSIDDETGGRILVVLPGTGTPVLIGEEVQVSGQVVKIDPVQFAASFGIQLPAEQVSGFVGVPCLVASNGPRPVAGDLPPTSR